MPNYTPNLNLEKPLGSEYYNVGVFNRNADILDEAVAAAAESGSNVFFASCSDSYALSVERTITLSDADLAKFKDGLPPNNSIFVIKFTYGWIPGGNDETTLEFNIDGITGSTFNVVFDGHDDISMNYLMNIGQGGIGIFSVESTSSAATFYFLSSSSQSYKQLSKVKAFTEGSYTGETPKNKDYYIPMFDLNTYGVIDDFGLYDYISYGLKYNPSTKALYSNSMNVLILTTGSLMPRYANGSISVGANLAFDTDSTYHNPKYNISGVLRTTSKYIDGAEKGNAFSNRKSVKITDTLSLKQIPSLEPDCDATYGMYYGNEIDQFGEVLSYLYYLNSDKAAPPASERDYSRERTILQIGNDKTDIVSSISRFGHVIDILYDDDYDEQSPWYGIRMVNSGDYTTDLTKADISTFPFLLFKDLLSIRIQTNSIRTLMRNNVLGGLRDQFATKGNITIALKNTSYANYSDVVVSDSYSISKAIEDIINHRSTAFPEGMTDILIYPGTYVCSDTINIDVSNVTIRGMVSTDRTIITTPDGNDGKFSVISIGGGAQHVTIKDITLTNGYSSVIMHDPILTFDAPTKDISGGNSMTLYNLIYINNVEFICNDYTNSSQDSRFPFISGSGSGISITNSTFEFTQSNAAFVNPRCSILIRRANDSNINRILFNNNMGLLNYNTADTYSNKIGVYIEMDDSTVDLKNTNVGFDFLSRLTP